LQQDNIQPSTGLQQTTNKTSTNKTKPQQDFNEVAELERQIDKLVYKLYNISPADQKIIEGKNGS
jgi:hypothetical protein